MLKPIATGREAPITVGALVWLLARVDTYMQLQIGHAAEYPPAYLFMRLSAIIIAFRGDIASPISLFLEVAGESRHNATDLGAVKKTDRIKILRQNQKRGVGFGKKVLGMDLYYCVRLTH